MTVTLEQSNDQTIAVGAQPGILSAINNPETGLVIWQRDVDASLTHAVDVLCRLGTEYVVSLDPYSKGAHKRIAESFETHSKYHLELLIEDILALAQRFSGLSMRQCVRIRIETVNDDGCRLFHLDNVAMRLVTTYAGRGTQWVEPKFTRAAHHQQTNYIGPLNTIRAGDIAIFKGKKSDAKNLILHRSPPMKTEQSPRFVAVIDPIDREQVKNNT